ncbi:hypothetical protein C8Q76DRAFT_753882 [Earliella scabrosa]|nr:hypothetical protein C8Q76DRAFT_753882 [Earliella scabrosa]
MGKRLSIFVALGRICCAHSMPGWTIAARLVLMIGCSCSLAPRGWANLQSLLSFVDI